MTQPALGLDLGQITFAVAGIPKTEGNVSARVMPGGRGRPPFAVIYHDKSHELQKWRKAIAREAREQWGDADPMTWPVAVTCAFVLPRPPSVTRPLPSVRPDLDKLIRAVYDAISVEGIDIKVRPVLADDGQITAGTQRKRYGDRPGVLVSIRPDTAEND